MSNVKFCVLYLPSYLAHNITIISFSSDVKYISVLIKDDNSFFSTEDSMLGWLVICEILFKFICRF
jgi:hypothetical protein